MKAILKIVYNTENTDDVNLVRDMQQVHNYKTVLSQIYDYLRSEVKYNTNLSSEACEVYSNLRQRMFMLLSEYDLSLE